MASSFDALPPEMVQKCVEFLDFDLVCDDLKAVSKATRGVARRALTRGRWKPTRYVAAEGLAFCTPARPADDLRSVDIEPDPILAARFTHRYFCFHLRAETTRIMAETWSGRWEDRATASVFMAEINRLIPPPDPDEDVWEDY